MIRILAKFGGLTYAHLCLEFIDKSVTINISSHENKKTITFFFFDKKNCQNLNFKFLSKERPAIIKFFIITRSNINVKLFLTYKATL